MRKNCRQTLEAWNNGAERHPADSVWTDGETVYSYRTAIVTTSPDGYVIVNRTPYSHTTTCHQNALAGRIGRYGVRHVLNVPIGAGPDALIERARESWYVPGVTYPRDLEAEARETIRRA